MKLINDIKGIFRKDVKLFVLVNIFYFGIVLVGAGIAVADPQQQVALLNQTGSAFGTGPLAAVGESYLSGNVLAAAAVTFVLNFFLGTLAMITVPSLAIPIFAPILGAFRAVSWGLMLVVPIEGLYPASIAVPHYLTLLLEGEAYVIAIFASLRQVKALWKPAEFGTDSRLKAYWRSIVDNGKLLPVVALVLAIAALYEAWEVIFFAGL